MTSHSNTGYDLQSCLRDLSNRTHTHPNLTKIWISYLSSRVPTYDDICDCRIALCNMDEICDIDSSLLPAIYGIGSILTNKE